MRDIYKLQLMASVIGLLLGLYSMFIWEFNHFESMVMFVSYWILANTYLILNKLMITSEKKEMAK